MMKISLRYKIALEFYACISFFTAIIISAYSIIYKLFWDNLLIPAAIIAASLIGLINSFKTLIIDVNSVKFVDDDSKDEPYIVEILVIEKVILELISSVSNILIITAFFVFGISRSGEANKEIISSGFIIILLIPLLFFIKSLIFDFRIIIIDKKIRENFFYQLINRKTLSFLVIALIIIFLIFASNKMTTSVGNLYQKSMSVGEETISDISSNLYITLVEGERKNTSEGQVIGITAYVESLDLDFNFNSITVKFTGRDTAKTLEYGENADESHFYYQGKRTIKGYTLLRKNEAGIVKVNLTSTNQELYSGDRGRIQLILGNGKIVYRDFRIPEYRGESKVILYSTTMT